MIAVIVYMLYNWVSGSLDFIVNFINDPEGVMEEIRRVMEYHDGLDSQDLTDFIRLEGKYDGNDRYQKFMDLIKSKYDIYETIERILDSEYSRVSLIYVHLDHLKLVEQNIYENMEDFDTYTEVFMRHDKSLTEICKTIKSVLIEIEKLEKLGENIVKRDIEIFNEKSIELSKLYARDQEIFNSTFKDLFS